MNSSASALPTPGSSKSEGRRISWRREAENAVEGVDTVEEARLNQEKLNALKQKADAKVRSFEYEEERNRLSYNGKGARKCPGSDCNNSFDPKDEEYCGRCAGCSKKFCIECHNECGCGKVWCWNCRQECCDETLCEGCCHFTCQRCDELRCEDCLREVGNQMHTLEWCISCEKQSRSRW